MSWPVAAIVAERVCRPDRVGVYETWYADPFHTTSVNTCLSLMLCSFELTLWSPAVFVPSDLPNDVRSSHGSHERSF